MNILITGASGGIGSAVAERFLKNGHAVFGLDLAPAPFEHPGYTHFVTDLLDEAALPALPMPEILFLNAGGQNSPDDIDLNLKSTIRVTEHYLRGNTALRSVLFNASASAVSGQEFPVYAASKAGLLGYMKNLAIRLAPRRIPCNAICLGGVYTPLNEPVVRDPELWKQIMDVTPMKKWTDTEEEPADRQRGISAALHLCLAGVRGHCQAAPRDGRTAVRGRSGRRFGEKRRRTGEIPTCF